MSLLAPGAFTTVEDPSPLSWDLIAAYGVGWATFQAQNGGNNPKDADLDAIRAQGIGDVGVWGVTYAVDDRNNNPRGLSFHDQNEILGRQATRLKADHVIVDIEECAKRTRASRGLKPAIAGVRAGGWTGAVSISTLGAPINPDVNDYEIDVQSFLETGGIVLPQAYANDWPEYDPEACVRYWTRVGVPRGRLNLTISLTAGDTSKTRWAGPDWLPGLQRAGLGNAWSIFMAEYATEADLAALKTLTPQPLGQAPAGAGRTPELTRRRMIDEGAAQVHTWIVEQGKGWAEVKRTRIYKALHELDAVRFPA
jgi:hypothetical protein